MHVYLSRTGIGNLCLHMHDEMDSAGHGGSDFALVQVRVHACGTRYLTSAQCMFRMVTSHTPTRHLCCGGCGLQASLALAWWSTAASRARHSKRVFITEAAQRPPRGRPEAATEAATEAAYENIGQTKFFHVLKREDIQNQRFSFFVKISFPCVFIGGLCGGLWAASGRPLGGLCGTRRSV